MEKRKLHKHNSLSESIIRKAATVVGTISKITLKKVFTNEIEEKKNWKENKKIDEKCFKGLSLKCRRFFHNF